VLEAEIARLEKIVAIDADTARRLTAVTNASPTKPQRSKA
jgi:hypothetical protein